MIYANVLVPNSDGARAVRLRRFVLHLGGLTIPPGANGMSESFAIIALGNTVPTTALLNQVGACGIATQKLYSAGAGVPATAMGAPVVDKDVSLEIPKAPANSKYYLTFAINSTNDAAFKTLYYYFECEVLY